MGGGNVCTKYIAKNLPMSEGMRTMDKEGTQISNLEKRSARNKQMRSPAVERRALPGVTTGPQMSLPTSLCSDFPTGLLSSKFSTLDFLKLKSKSTEERRDFYFNIGSISSHAQSKVRPNHDVIGVWSRERFPEGPCKEMGGSCP